MCLPWERMADMKRTAATATAGRRSARRPPSPADPYVDFLMQQWRMGEQSRRIQTAVRRILNELGAEAHLNLRDPKLEVAVLAESAHSVWAYFPIHRNRLIAQKVRPKPQTRVLLVFSTAGSEEAPADFFEDCLRDHLGHTLLYLRDPKAHNECPDAQREWRMSAVTENLHRNRRPGKSELKVYK